MQFYLLFICKVFEYFLAITSVLGGITARDNSFKKGDCLESILASSKWGGSHHSLHIGFLALDATTTLLLCIPLGALEVWLVCLLELSSALLQVVCLVFAYVESIIWVFRRFYLLLLSIFTIKLYLWVVLFVLSASLLFLSGVKEDAQILHFFLNLLALLVVAVIR